MPLELGVCGSRGAVLELGEVGLEEGDLVLVGGRGLVLGRGLDGEVVELLALVDGRLGLGDELSAQHGLAIPLCRLVDGDLGTLLGSLVGGVLERSIEVDVVGHGAGTVDVVLVGTDGVGEGPFGQIGTGGHVVEATVPDDF